MSWLETRNEVWLRKRDFAFETLKEYRDDKEWHHSDADMWENSIVYNDALLVVEDLVGDLKVSLESNPFPGQRKGLVAVAVEVFPPETGVKFAPGAAQVTGAPLWREVFDIGEIDYTERIYFPEVAEGWDVEEIERKLLLLVREDNSIPASEVSVTLCVNANSKTYRTMKVSLEGRGWVWKQRKVKGKVEKVVFAPAKG